jgi:hypothetical protein
VSQQALTEYALSKLENFPLSYLRAFWLEGVKDLMLYRKSLYCIYEQ